MDAKKRKKNRIFVRKRRIKEIRKRTELEIGENSSMKVK